MSVFHISDKLICVCIYVCTNVFLKASLLYPAINHFCYHKQTDIKKTNIAFCPQIIFRTENKQFKNINPITLGTCVSPLYFVLLSPFSSNACFRSHVLFFNFSQIHCFVSLSFILLFSYTAFIWLVFLFNFSLDSSSFPFLFFQKQIYNQHSQ